MIYRDSSNLGIIVITVLSEKLDSKWPYLIEKHDRQIDEHIDRYANRSRSDYDVQ